MTTVTIDGKEYILVQHGDNKYERAENSEIPKGLRRTDWVYYRYYKTQNGGDYLDGQSYAHQVSWYNTRCYAVIKSACIDSTWITHDGGMRPVHPETVVDVCFVYYSGEFREIQLDKRAKEIDWEVDCLKYRIVSEYIVDKQAKEIEALKMELAVLASKVCQLATTVTALKNNA